MFSAKPKYFPRNIGVALPQGENVHEFVVVWGHEFGSLGKIVDVFSRHRVKVLLTHSQIDEQTNTAVGTYFCDLTRADRSADDIGKEIKALGFVREVESVSAAKSLFDKFLFPVTVWGRDRVIVMRLDPLLNVEGRLTEELGSAGSAIMFSEGEGYASETIDQYVRVLPGASPEALLDTVKDGLRATGWGLFDFKKSKDGYTVTIEDAPMQAGATEPSRFLCGIVAGILERVYSAKLKVAESMVDHKNRRAVVRLTRAEGAAPG